MKTVFVTGGAGFIGSNFIRHILNKYDDYRVVNLDKLTYAGNLDNLKDISKDKRYKFVKGDIADAKIVEKAAKGCEAIVNFAAETHVDRSIHGAAEFVRTNVFGLHTLLETARKLKTGLFIQISTDEVYGSIAEGSFKETDPLFPNSPYSATKASGDLLARSYFVTYKLPVIITRSSNNFGPNQYPEKIIPLFITNLLRNKRVPLYADGMNVRDWLYVIDNCEAIDLIMHKGRTGEIYNIGGITEITNLELTYNLLEMLGKDKGFIKYVKDRPGHDKRYSLDITKLKALGWRPRHNFKEALEVTIDWYRENKPWWVNILRHCEEAEGRRSNLKQ
ncbi:MAG: dTDP-glucose 4,6-dehydratase [Candidatus Omnitrophota bacterium]|nr:dTDP-glucose 4,6-dehydratase [Candidatus Omnitrophota bacterium]